MPHNDIETNYTDVKKRWTSYPLRVIFAVAMSWFILRWMEDCGHLSLSDFASFANDNDIKEGAINHDQHCLPDPFGEGTSRGPQLPANFASNNNDFARNHDRLPEMRQCPSTEGTSRGSQLPWGTHLQQALLASIADIEKENTNYDRLPEMMAALRHHPSSAIRRHRASSSSGTPTASPSSTASSPTSSASSSRGNRRSPSTTSSPPLRLAPPRRSSSPPGLPSPPTCSGGSPRSALSSPPVRASTTSTWLSAGGGGSRSLARGTRSRRRRCPSAEGTSRGSQLPWGSHLQQALLASFADIKKENTNYDRLPEMTAALRHPSLAVRRCCASSSLGTPTASPSSTASSPTSSASSSRGNRRSPSTTSSPPLRLAPPRRSSSPPGLPSPSTCCGSSPRSALSLPPAQASTTLTWPSAGCGGSRSPARGTRSWSRQCPSAEGTSRGSQLLRKFASNDNDFARDTHMMADSLPRRQTSSLESSSLAPNSSDDIESYLSHDIANGLPPGESTSHDIEIGLSWGESTSHDGGAHSLDHVRSQQRFANSSHDIENGLSRGESTSHDGRAHSLDHVRSQQRFAIPHKLLFELNNHAAVAVAGFLINGPLSQVKDVVRYGLIFLFVLGFLAFLGGESIHNNRIRGTGSVATVFAFLISMLLLVMHKN